MKKEYLILGLVILSLSLYLLFHSTEKTNYDLPELPRVDVEQITSIDIEKNGTIINFQRKDNAWTVSEENYPVDNTAIKTVLNVIKDLKMSALVSETRDLIRYDLDDKNGVKVTAKKGSELLRSFYVGKVAPTNNHTFVRLADSTLVYHALGNFRRDFDKDMEGFRSKKVFSLERESLTSLVVKKGDLKREFFIDKKEGKEGAPLWKARDGKAVNIESLESLIADLADLECASYSVDKKTSEDKAVLFSILVSTGLVDTGKKATLSLYEKVADGHYPGTSSETSYPFILNSYQGDDLALNIDKVLGIDQKLEKKEVK